MTDRVPSPTNRPPQEDARDLLSRLYREIGISAVAAALELTTHKSAPKAELTAEQMPAILKDDMAA
jgi:hypothetical protein